MKKLLYILFLLISQNVFSQYIVNDAFKKITLYIPNISSSGEIGTAFETVDHYSSFAIDQTTPSRVFTLPAPTDTTWGDDVTIRNIGSVSFTMYGITVNDSFDLHLTWKRGAWLPVGSYGGSSSASSSCCECDTILFFKNDSIASLAGINRYGHYLTSAGNSYGMAWGMVKIETEYYVSSGVLAAGCISNYPDAMQYYKSDSEAKTLGGLVVGKYYLLDSDNLYAMSLGTIKRITE